MPYFEMRFFLSHEAGRDDKHHCLVAITPWNGANMTDLNDFTLELEGKLWKIKEDDVQSCFLETTKVFYYNPARTLSFTRTEVSAAEKRLEAFKNALESFIPARVQLARYKALGPYEDVAAAVSQASKKRKTMEEPAPHCTFKDECSKTLHKCSKCSAQVCTLHSDGSICQACLTE
jgi:hypothetical protein